MMVNGTKPASKFHAMFLRTNIPKQLNRNQIPTPMIGNIIPIPMCWNEIPTRVCRNEIPMGHGRNCPLSIILPPATLLLQERMI